MVAALKLLLLIYNLDEGKQFCCALKLLLQTIKDYLSGWACLFFKALPFIIKAFKCTIVHANI
jgi:hypothetical protein